MKKQILVAILAVMFLAAGGAMAQGVLFVVNDMVGIGTNVPTAPLDIAPPSGNAAFRLSFASASQWAISNTGEVVTFNKIGSGGQEATFRTRLDADGTTFEVQGSVAGTQFINTSSRELKTDFAALDAQAVLSKLADMPVTSWRYKFEDESAPRHFGPVAEDFQASFALGDGKTISTVDAQGVTMAAIKGLHQLVEARDSEIDALRAELDELKSLVLAGQTSR